MAGLKDAWGPAFGDEGVDGLDLGGDFGHLQGGFGWGDFIQSEGGRKNGERKKPLSTLGKQGRRFANKLWHNENLLPIEPHEET